MTDLRDQFRVADHIQAPDVWPSVERRLAEAPDDRAAVRLIGSRAPRTSRRDPLRKALTIAAAFAIAAASTAFAIHSFRSGGRQQPASGMVLASIPVGDWSDIAGGYGAVWVVTQEGDVLRVDTATNKIIATIPLGGATQTRSIAAGEGAVWVSYDQTVQRIDPETNEIVATIDISGGAGQIAAGLGSVWVGQNSATGNGSVVRIDPATNAIVTTVPIDIDFESLAVGDGAVWVKGTAPGSARIARVDAATNSVSTAYEGPFGVSLGDLTFADGALWTMSCDERGVGPPRYESHPRCASSILRLDPRSGDTSSVPIGTPHPETSGGVTTLVDLYPSLLDVEGGIAWVSTADLRGVQLASPEVGLSVTPGSRLVDARVLEIDAASGRTLSSSPLAQLEPPDGISFSGVAGDVEAGDLWLLTRSGSLLRVAS